MAANKLADAMCVEATLEDGDSSCIVGKGKGKVENCGFDFTEYSRPYCPHLVYFYGDDHESCTLESTHNK